MKEKTNNKKYKITLVLGDWSDDGHGKTDVYVINSNINSTGLQQAYDLGCEKIGFNFIDEVCADYEDASISLEYLKKLMDHGLTLENLFDNLDYEIKEAKKSLEEDLDDVGLWTKSYLYIYLFICQLGNENFKYEIAKDNSQIHIGGYGLFT